MILFFGCHKPWNNKVHSSNMDDLVLIKDTPGRIGNLKACIFNFRVKTSCEALRQGHAVEAAAESTLISSCIALFPSRNRLLGIV